MSDYKVVVTPPPAFVVKYNAGQQGPAGAATSLEWADILSKPSTFTPSAHVQAIDTITGLQAALDGLAGQTTTNASLLTSGTLADPRLSANVAMRNAANSFVGDQSINGQLLFTGTNIVLSATLNDAMISGHVSVNYGLWFGATWVGVRSHGMTYDAITGNLELQALGVKRVTIGTDYKTKFYNSLGVSTAEVNGATGAITAGTVVSKNASYPLGTVTIRQQANDILPGTAAQGLYFARHADGVDMLGIGCDNSGVAQVKSVYGSGIDLNYGITLYCDATNPTYPNNSLSDGGFKSRNRANNADAPITAGAITASGIIDGATTTTGHRLGYLGFADSVTLGWPGSSYGGFQCGFNGVVSWLGAGLSLGMQSSGVMQVGNGGANALGSLACAAITVTGAITSTFQSLSANPSTLELTASQSRLVKNTTSGVVSLFVNDGGTIKSVALT